MWTVGGALFAKVFFRANNARYPMIRVLGGENNIAPNTLRRHSRRAIMESVKRMQMFVNVALKQRELEERDNCGVFIRREID